MILAILILLMPIVGPIIVIAYFLLTIVFNSVKLIAQIIKTITFNLKEILQKRQRAKTAIKAKNLERIKQERQKANEYKKLINLIEKKLPQSNKPIIPQKQKVSNYFSKQQKIDNKLNRKKNFCNKCGALFEEGSFKCSYCGNKLIE